MLDLVVNHTSDEHPWFVSAAQQPGLALPRLVCLERGRSRPTGIRALSSRASRQRPGPSTSRRRPGTSTASTTSSPTSTGPIPRSGREIAKVMALLAAAGGRPASGSTPHRSSSSRSSPGVDPGPQDFSILDSWRQDTQWQRGDSVLLCEANVAAERGRQVRRQPTGRADRPGADDVRLPAQPEVPGSRWLARTPSR